MQKKFVNLQRRMTELAVALAAIPKKARCSRFARRLGSSTTRMSFVSVMCIAVGAAVSAQVPRVHKVDACKLLLEAARSTPIIDLNTKYLSQGSTWLSCEYTDVGPGQNLLDAQWRVGFGFVPNRSIAEAEKNYGMSPYWRAKLGLTAGQARLTAAQLNAMVAVRPVVQEDKGAAWMEGYEDA